jgi:hypothetical protein
MMPTMYQVVYRSPLDGKVYRLRRKYNDLISAQSAADDYNVTTDCWNPITHWIEPVEEPIEAILDNPHQSLISNT